MSKEVNKSKVYMFSVGVIFENEISEADANKYFQNYLDSSDDYYGDYDIKTAEITEVKPASFKFIV